MIICVDFDGTIVNHSYPYIGMQIGRSVEILKWARSLGHIVILWTSRVPYDNGDIYSGSLDAAVEWCESHGLVFDAVNKNYEDIYDDIGFGYPKVVADWYIDDRSKPPSQRGDLTMWDWNEIERELQQQEDGRDAEMG